MFGNTGRVGKLHTITVNTDPTGNGKSHSLEQVNGLIGTIYLKYHPEATPDTTVSIVWELQNGIRAELVTIHGNHNRTIAVGIEQIGSVGATQAIIIGGLQLEAKNVGGQYVRAVTAYVVTMTTSENVAPMLYAHDIVMDENTSKVITLNYQDADGDPPAWDTLKLEAMAENCTIQLNTPQPGQITVIPKQNFAGLDGISLNVQDNKGNVSNALFISIVVNEVNDAPTLEGANWEADEDESVDYNIANVFRDPDPGDTPNWATLELITSPNHAQVLLNTPQPGFVRYIPYENIHGADEFSLRVQDNNGAWSNPATFTITVNPVNDAPVLIDAGFPTNEDTPFDYDLSQIYSDVEGDPANWTTLETTTAPTKGTLQLNVPTQGKVRYTPQPNTHGTDSFKLRVQDIHGAWSNIATINVVIHPVDDNPTLANASLLTLEDTSKTLDIKTLYSSPEGTVLDPRSIVISQAPAQGTAQVDPTTGVLTYSPRLNYHGADIIKLRAKDITGQLSNEAIVTVTVTPVAEQPVVFAYHTDTFENQPVTIQPAELNLAIDNDGMVDWRTVQIVATPAHGGVTVNAATGAMTYTPALNNRTPVTFRWRVKDNEGNTSADAVISITILETWLVQAIKAYAPVDYRRLNETSGTFADSSGSTSPRQAANKVSASEIGYNGGTAPDGSPAVEIMAADQYIDIVDPASKAVFAGNQWTVLLFFASKSFNWNDGKMRIAWQFWERTPFRNQSYQAKLGTGAWQSNVKNGGNLQQHETAPLPAADRAWHSSAVVFSGVEVGNTLAYYLDGVQVGSDTSTVDPNVSGETTLRIGNGSDSWLNGLVAHMAIWNKALSASAIAEMSKPRISRYATLRLLGNRHKMLLGVAVANNYDTMPAEYHQIATNDFAVLGTENAPKYSTLYVGGKNNPVWKHMEQFVKACVKHNLLQALHCLFWHADGKVTWLQNEPKTPQNARQLIEQRVAELRQWYDTHQFPEPYSIDVCNEMITTILTEVSQGRPLRTDHVWSQMYGNGTGTQASSRQWLIDCYHITREYFPNSLLIIADFHNEKKDYFKGDAFYNLVVSLLNAGVPIDGVHFQGHIDMKPMNSWLFDPQKTIDQIARFKALRNRRGLPLYVGFSEMDVKLVGGDPAVQEAIWHNILKTVSGLVDYFGIWGVDDGHSWLNTPTVNNYGTLYSNTYAKKPVWYQAAQGMWDAPLT